MITRLAVPLSAACAFASAAFLYRHVVVKLVHDWATDGNYSHGFLIVPISLYLAWERREALARAPHAPSIVGLGIILASLAVLAAGVLGAELFLTRVSLIGVVGGSVLFLLGWRHLKMLAFPIVFLLLMVPIPAIVFNQVALPLQLLASRCAEFALRVVGIPVLREGNVINLANITLEVAEACSGIRSLISLFTLALVYGYFVDNRPWARVVLAAAAVPVAVISNGIRVAGTGVAAHYFGLAAAEGFFHTVSGWLLFAIAFFLLFGVQRLLAAVGFGSSITSGAAPAPGVVQP